MLYSLSAYLKTAGPITPLFNYFYLKLIEPTTLLTQMPIEIPLYKLHICSDVSNCQYSIEPNPTSKKCIMSGKLEEGSPQILLCTSSLWEDDGIMDPDEIVIEDNKVNVEFKYPLSGKFLFGLEGCGNGITRRKIVEFIRETYIQIYKEDVSTGKEKVIKQNPSDVSDREFSALLALFGEPKLVDPNATGISYGILGHDLSDLCLEKIEYYSDEKIVRLGVGA